MPLRLRSTRIQGFKAIGDATLHWHPRVNVITGPNNSGKTTVLEALALWVESFDRICTQAGKSNKSRGVRRGDWYLGSVQVHHSDVVSVRSPGFADLFHRDADRLVITASFDDDEGSFDVPLAIRKARGGHYEFEQPRDHSKINPRLNRSCSAWPNPFRVLFASPVAAVQTSEEFLTPGKTADMIRRRRSAEVLRNRIHRLYSRANDFQRFLDDVGRVLTGSAGRVEIKIHGDPNTDIRAGVYARLSARDWFRDISLLGSGSLQIIEVLLDLYLADTRELDLVLLDEPDSHIHRDIQRRLLDVIEERADQTQVFLTTHNESLLRNVGWDRVFHLEPAPSERPRDFRPVASEHVVAEGRRHGLLASPLRNALSSIGVETALDLLNALEAEHFLLVEGSGDAALIDRLFDVGRMGGRSESAMYWCLNGIDEGLRALASLKLLLTSVRNDRSLWEKAVLILDRDLLTVEHVDAVVSAFEQRMEVRAVFWDARTVEAVLLSGGPSAGLRDLLFRVGRAAEMSGLVEDLSEEACRNAWDALGRRLATKWDKPNVARTLSVLRQRLESLALIKSKKFKGNPLSGGDEKILQQVLDFHQDQVAAGRYWQVAAKDDVEFFVAEAFRGMGVTEQAVSNWLTPSWFRTVILEIRRLRDFPALRSMHQRLRA